MKAIPTERKEGYPFQGNLSNGIPFSGALSSLKLFTGTPNLGSVHLRRPHSRHAFRTAVSCPSERIDFCLPLSWNRIGSHCVGRIVIWTSPHWSKLATVIPLKATHLTRLPPYLSFSPVSELNERCLALKSFAQLNPDSKLGRSSAPRTGRQRERIVSRAPVARAFPEWDK